MKTGDASEAGTNVSREEFEKLQGQLELLSKTNSPDKLLLENKEAKDVNSEALLKELIAGLQKKDDLQKYGSGYDYVEEKDIDPKDYLEHGTTFFVHKVGYVIVDDMRNGLPVRVPFGKPIIFQYQSTEKRQVGKHIELHNLATYTSFSQKEVDWLRKDTKFGLIFFDNIRTALNVNARLAEKLAKSINAVNNMEYNRVIQSCQGNDLPVTANVDEMRSQLAHFLAQAELEAEKDAQMKRTKDSIKDAAVLQRD